MRRAPLRVVLAEDSVLVREGMVELLARFGHRVVAAVGDAAALVAAVDEHRPDIVITDVRMPPGQLDEGLRAAVELRSRHPELAVLVLSQYVATAYATDLVGDGKSGAGLGYLLKDRVNDVVDFVEAVQWIAGGGTVIDPEVIHQMITRRRDTGPLDRLTARERDVLREMAAGRSNGMIAERLSVTEAAVNKHVGNIFSKLDLTQSDGHRRVLAVLAYLRGE